MGGPSSVYSGTPYNTPLPSTSAVPVSVAAPPGATAPQPNSTRPSNENTTILTSLYTTTITQPTTTFTSLYSTTITQPATTFTPLAATTAASPAPTPSPDFGTTSVCTGNGWDASATGLVASIVIPSVVGLLIWLIFAIIRPHFRQVYALREWFVQPDIRPQPLRSTLWAFLFPPVPLIPSVTEDVDDAGKSPAKDGEIFPSDEQVSQRSLWVAFLIVLGWAFLACLGALPLYLVSTPCVESSTPPASFGGAYSTLQDLSLLRLLQLLENGNVTKNGLQSRAFVNSKDVAPNTRIRIIILTVLTIVLGVLPALWKIVKEFNAVVNYRRRWIEFRCEGQDLGWLSARKAPGFDGWGERRIKEFILKSGLSSSLDANGKKESSQAQSRRTQEHTLTNGEKAGLEVDIKSLFSISDTQQLALLIDDRDQILQNLEIAETRYISSFQLSTPEPSIADLPPIEPPPTNRPRISRPRALGGARRNRRTTNPAYAASSLAPTSFVAPSTYYKLRGVQGVNGGRFSTLVAQPSLEESINLRVVGSRFQEQQGSSNGAARPRGTGTEQVRDSAARTSSTMPDIARYGPNHDQSMDVDELGVRQSAVPTSSQGDHSEDRVTEWVDNIRRAPVNFGDDLYGGTHTPQMAPSEIATTSRQPRPANTPTITERRETFPRRYDASTKSPGGSDLPPHLRLQPQQPFVRPVSGLNHDDLGSVYSEISSWRSRLKLINAEIAQAQEDCYNDIADGARIKGWVMVGRGLRFIPGVELIEGRAKEDIRWDVLQNERTTLDVVVFWMIVGIVLLLLAAGLLAATGLALANAPNVAHLLPFLRPLADDGRWPLGLITTLVPAVAATVFIVLALSLIDWASRIRGHASVSGGQLYFFKISFFILVLVATIWLIAVGAIVFSLQALISGAQETKSVADGSIYMSVLALCIVFNAAIIFPGLLLLQPIRLWNVKRAVRHAITPRQRFRAIYPRTYNPSYAVGACVLAIIFASTFALIFPLIAPPIVILLFLTLVAHRYLVGYVFARTHSQTGGLLQIWLLRRFGTLLAFQPILLGLILLSRQLWPEAGVLLGVGVLVIVFMETWAHHKTKLPKRESLSAITQDSLDTFTRTAMNRRPRTADQETASLVSEAPRGARARGSMASVLEMMSTTLAVMPSPTVTRGPVPLSTETLDDLIATERAARTHPDAPPHLPPLHFTDHAEEMAGILYAPELIAPPPIIWLPNDSAGVARSEAVDLQRYHDLRVVLDVRKTSDALPPRTSSSLRNRQVT